MDERDEARKSVNRSFKVLQNGFAIREFREMKDLSGSALAARMDISPGTLCNIEFERRSASPQMLLRIAVALGVPIEAITREQEDRPPPPTEPPVPQAIQAHEVA